MKTKSSLTLSIYQEHLKPSSLFYSGSYSKGNYQISQPTLADINENKNPELPKIKSPSRKVCLKPIKVFAESAKPSPQSSPRSRVSALKIRNFPCSTNQSSIASLFTNDIASSRNYVSLESERKGRAGLFDSYLKFLDENNKIDLESFKVKIGLKKNEVRTKKIEKQRPSRLENIDIEGPIMKQIIRSRENSAEGSPKHLPRLPSIQVSTPISFKDMLSVGFTPLSKKLGTLSNSKPTSRRNTPTMIGRFFANQNLAWQTPDENVSAAQLVETICKNFKVIQEAASQTRECRKKLLEILQKEDAMEIFYTKTKKNLPLFARIYSDMTEYAETPFPSGTKSFEPRISGFSKVLSRGRVIREKYQSYKKINSYFEDLILSYKMQSLNRLENDLLKAHDDFKMKKSELLSQVKQKRKGHYNHLKKKYEKYESMIPIYNYEDFAKNIDKLENKYGDSVKLDGSKRIINKELNEFMRKWTNKVLEIA